MRNKLILALFLFVATGAILVSQETFGPSRGGGGSGAGVTNIFIRNTNGIGYGTITVQGDAGFPGSLNLFGTNGANYTELRASKDIASNSSWVLPTNGANGNLVGVMVATNAGASSNQLSLAAIGAGLLYDGTTLRAPANTNLTNVTITSISGGPSLALLVETNRFVVTNGNVGIGTTAPTNAFNVVGASTFEGTITNAFQSAAFLSGVLLTNGQIVSTGKIYGCNGIATDAGGNSLDLNTSCQVNINSFNSKISLSSGSSSFSISGSQRFGMTSTGVVANVANAAVTPYRLGGTLVVSNNPIASAGASQTNLITFPVPANVLTNNTDRLKFRFSGRFAATANTKDLFVILGSETILDTGAQIVNSGAWTIEGEIIRTGNTSQTASAEFHGAGVTLFTTAAAVSLSQTNGIATTLKMMSTAAGDGDVTNRTMVVEYWPAP